MEKLESDQVLELVQKPALANRYQVGFRTLENWQASGIIVGKMERHKWWFDVQDCDRRLFLHSKSTPYKISGIGSAGNARIKK
jgi:hypothetical protein